MVKTLPPRKAPPVRGTNKHTLWKKGRDLNVKAADILTTLLQSVRCQYVTQNVSKWSDT